MSKNKFLINQVDQLNFSLTTELMVGYHVDQGVVLHVSHSFLSQAEHNSNIDQVVSDCLQNFTHINVSTLYIIFCLIEPGSSHIAYQKILNTITQWASYYNFSFHGIKTFRPEYCSRIDLTDANQEVKNVYVDTFYPFTSLFMHSKVSNSYQLSTTSSKALFLVGKPLKPHRLPLLYTMAKQNMIPGQILHSFHKDLFGKTSYPDILGILCQYCDYQIDMDTVKTFVKKFTNVLDIRDGIKQGGKQVVYGKILNSTMLDVITETFSDYSEFSDINRTYFTEKTVISLLTGRPFLHYSHNTKVHEELQNQGYRTFEKYTDITNVDQLTDMEKFCGAVTNILNSSAKKQMLLDAVHNKKISHSRVKSEINKLNQEFPDLKNNTKLLKYILYRF